VFDSLGRCERWPILLVAVAVLATGCGSENAPAALSRVQVHERLRGSPVALRRLHVHAAQLLRSTPASFQALLTRLRGYPVVVNEWASWCDNCRAEAAAFQVVSVKFGKRVAFLGVDVEDHGTSARQLLARTLPAYPSYSDPHQAIASSLEAVGYDPQTLFYDARGQRTIVHGGSYLTAAALERDVRRYALAQ
jgi:cytochrome c biogenesis protein CcmG, thiol:disulfide interchange protein DsbE